METVINTPISKKQGRNQLLEVSKLIGAVLVVFAHVTFPGDLGGFLSVCARCTVPLFFAIAGYFSYQTGAEALLRRMKHIALLELLGVGCALVAGCLLTELAGGSTVVFLKTMLPLNANTLARWLLLCVDPVSYPLWYLTASFECYLFLWIYVRFFGKEPVDYRYLYLAGFFLFTVNLSSNLFSAAAGLPFSFLQYRNAVFFGIPLFAMGMFLREHQDRILENLALTKGKLCLLIQGGILFSVMEWKGIILSDTFVGCTFTVLGVILLSRLQPRLTRPDSVGEKLIARFGSWSTGIYLLHYPLSLLYSETPLKSIVCSRLGLSELWSTPVIVLGATFVLVVLWDALWRRLTRLRTKKV